MSRSGAENISLWEIIARTVPTLASGDRCRETTSSAASICDLLPIKEIGFFPGATIRFDLSLHAHNSIPGEEILHKAHAIGQYYGFTPFSLSPRKRAARARIETSKVRFPIPITTLSPEQIIHFLKRCRNIECAPTARRPLFIWHTNIAPGRPIQKKTALQFHALGTDRAIADAVVIRALLALSRDLFREESAVRINSMGDKETRARYARELGVFFRKRAGALPEECVERAKQDVFSAAEYALSHDCADDLPAPTEHLSDASRKRFEDLLEYLEMTETPYELARHLLAAARFGAIFVLKLLSANGESLGVRATATSRDTFSPAHHFLLLARHFI